MSEKHNITMGVKGCSHRQKTKETPKSLTPAVKGLITINPIQNKRFYLYNICVWTVYIYVCL